MVFALFSFKLCTCSVFNREEVFLATFRIPIIVYTFQVQREIVVNTVIEKGSVVFSVFKLRF